MSTPSNYQEASSALDELLAGAEVASDGANDFQDTDGLLAFVNLASSFITSSPSFKTARDLCDKTSNLFGTLLPIVFAAMTRTEKPLPPPPGYPMPLAKWDPAVVQYVRELLQKSGGITNFRLSEETFSRTMVLADFSVDFLKIIFDAAVVPEKVISDVSSFLEGVGQSLRTSWDTQSKTYRTQLLSQCHEAIQLEGSDTYYYPKVKYVEIAVTSQQTEFTSPCVKTQSITFNFNYTYWVTGFAGAVLEKGSTEWTRFDAFLNRAQLKNYEDATNTIDQLLEGVVSGPASGDDPEVFAGHPRVTVS